ncbi:MAG: hypothetical protein A3F72_04760 [Bacteroidetes bacterium RIFCSPLOWO2_12_FULL_35_15]|nr:MAG: hypothetical protein A3F72_04760 [Bacteroidetes bacterium RIFCSPLOWO2_12_FULL_35_15]
MTKTFDYFKIIGKYILKISKIITITLGCIAFIMCALAFTSAPYWTRYWLGTTQGKYYFNPDYIVMLGGSGMPSEDNLMRLYHTASVSKKYPSAFVIILHPKDSTVYWKMKNELLAKNIDSTKISFDTIGTNTRSQALGLVETIPTIIDSKIVIVTSPEHVLRSVLVFRKAGFKNIGACPATDSDMNIDLSFDGKKLGGRKYIPDVGENINMRYNFWSYLKIEIICLREFTALGYYKLKGWI